MRKSSGQFLKHFRYLTYKTLSLKLELVEYRISETTLSFCRTARRYFTCDLYNTDTIYATRMTFAGMDIYIRRARVPARRRFWRVQRAVDWHVLQKSQGRMHGIYPSPGLMTGVSVARHPFTRKLSVFVSVLDKPGSNRLLQQMWNVYVRISDKWYFSLSIWKK